MEIIDGYSRKTIDLLRESTQRGIRMDREFLAELNGIRKKFSGALPAEYVYEKMLLRKQHGVAAISTGVCWWDEWAGPFRRANLYCLAGYQGSGKTTLAVALTWQMALKGVKVWNVCLELTAEEMFEVVGGHVLGKASLTSEDFATAYATIQGTGYRFFEAERDVNWKENLERICDTVRKDKIDMVVIDNFSYLTSVERNSYETERVAAKALKSLAQELEIPILCIAHLRKPDRDDSEPNPTAHSVLGSGALTQAASDTFILHHPLAGDSESNSRHPVGYILSGKPRWTVGGKRYVRYLGWRRAFSEATAEQYRRQFPDKGKSPERKYKL